MITIQQSYQRLIKSKEFKGEGVLCSMFFTSDIKEIEESNWQIDFYNKESNTITSYLMGINIEVVPNSEIFKEENTDIEDFKIEDVKISFKESLKVAKEHLKEEATKIIVILQKQKDIMWNISFVTKNFNLLNIKIDAINGKVIEEKLVSLISFKK